MGLKSFKESGEEQDAIFTSPNVISVGRGVCGVVLGGVLATNNIDPGAAVVAAGVLGATDMEGSLISLTSRWPQLQHTLRAYPSRIGRKLDAVMDKLFAVSVFAGSIIGGYMPSEQAAPILVTEAATAGTTMYVTKEGGDPEVGRAGTFGMCARMGSMVLNLGASAAESGEMHDRLAVGGLVSTVAAVCLGAVSCRDIWRQRPSQQIDYMQDAA